MSESPPNTLKIALEGLIRRIIREEIGSLKGVTSTEDRLLAAGEAAKLLSVSEDWLYRHAKRLPFTRNERKTIDRIGEVVDPPFGRVFWRGPCFGYLDGSCSRIYLAAPGRGRK